MIISFIGNDGSGKTTIAKELYSLFRSLGFDTYYKHEYEYIFIKHLFNLIDRRKNLERARSEKESHQRSLRYQIWPLLVIFDVALQYIFFKTFKRRTIILLDRYVYDHYMSFRYLGTLNRLSEWLFLHFPRPDILVLLWADPKVAYERKKDSELHQHYTVAFYQEQLDRYFDLTKKLQISLINTEDSKEKTRKVILELFLQHKKLKKQFLEHCAKNRLLSVALEMPELDFLSNEPIKKLVDDEQEKTIKTLTFITTMPVEKLVYKSYSDVKNVMFNDFDLLIAKEDLQKCLDHIRNAGGRVSSTEAAKFDCLVDGLKRIEIHFSATWEGIEYVSREVLWRDSRTVQMLGTPIMIPNYGADLLVHAAHIIFSNSFIRFHDYLYINHLLSSNLDLDAVRNEAKQFGWERSFVDFINLIKGLENRSIEYPYFLPFNFVIKSLFCKINHDIKEKKFTLNVLRAVTKAMIVFSFWRIRYRTTRKLPFTKTCTRINNV